jgi:hypothetical protein
MPAPKADLRLPPILHAYLEDLARLGAYGKGKTGVMRRFIEDGIQRALADKVIAVRHVDAFDADDEDDAG